MGSCGMCASGVVNDFDQIMASKEEYIIEGSKVVLDHAQSYITEHAEHAEELIDEKVKNEIESKLTPKQEKEVTIVYEKIKELVKKEAPTV